MRQSIEFYGKRNKKYLKYQQKYIEFMKKNYYNIIIIKRQDVIRSWLTKVRQMSRKE